MRRRWLPWGGRGSCRQRALRIDPPSFRSSCSARSSPARLQGGRAAGFARWLCCGSSGFGALASDYVVNQEDVVFHLVLTAVMIGLAAGAASPCAQSAARRRRRSSAGRVLLDAVARVSTVPAVPALAGVFAGDAAAIGKLQVPGVQVAPTATATTKGPDRRHSGPLTRGAIRKFQKDKGLEADGVVGTRTRTAFGNFGGHPRLADAPPRDGRLRRLGAPVPARQARLPDEVAEQQLRRRNGPSRAQVPAPDAAARGRDRRAAHPSRAVDRKRRETAPPQWPSRCQAHGPPPRRAAGRNLDGHRRARRHNRRGPGAEERPRPAGSFCSSAHGCRSRKAASA